MPDGMQYDPMQGQGHDPFKVGNIAIFKSYLRHLQWELATDHWFIDQAEYLNLFGPDLQSRPSVPYGAIFFKFCTPSHIFGVGETKHFKSHVLIDTELY